MVVWRNCKKSFQTEGESPIYLHVTKVPNLHIFRMQYAFARVVDPNVCDDLGFDIQLA